jgi:uncharacterized protein
MTLDKPSKPEDDYFAAEEVEAKRKLAFHQGQMLAQQQQEALRKLHYMKCPKCGFDLHALDAGTVHLDSCFNCKGVFLEAGDLEKLKAEAAHEHRKAPLISAIINLFKRD